MICTFQRIVSVPPKGEAGNPASSKIEGRGIVATKFIMHALTHAGESLLAVHAAVGLPSVRCPLPRP